MKGDFYSRYYKRSEAEGAHAFGVVSLGFNRCAAKLDYDFFQKKHPTDRRFSKRTGRTLQTVVMEFVTSGRGMFRSEPTGRRTVSPNTVFFTFPGVNTFSRYDDETGWNEKWIEFDPSAVLPLLAAYGITPERPMHTFRAASQVNEAFQALFDVSVNEDPAAHVLIEAAAHRVLAEVLAVWNRADKPSAADLAVERVRQALLSDFSDARPVEQAVRESGMGLSRMRELFKNATGLSPKQYQMRARFVRAAKMLRDTDLPIADVALGTGFESLSGFSHRFRRAFGLSPAAYRRRDSVGEKSKCVGGLCIA